MVSLSSSPRSARARPVPVVVGSALERLGVRVTMAKVLQALGLLSQVEKLLDPREDPETLAYAERQLRSP